MDDDDVVWCLICEQRPVEGTLRRVFMDTHAPVIARPKEEAIPRICQECANAIHGMPAENVNGRRVLWEFILEDPVPADDGE